MSIKEIILELIAPKPNTNGMSMDGVTLCGDSIMYVDVAAQLREQGYYVGKVINDQSIPGDTAQNLWYRLPYTSRCTKRVVVEQGTNDLTRGVDPLPYLKKIVKYLQAEGRSVVLTGIPPRDDIRVMDYNLRILDLAIERKAGYADWGSVSGNRPDGLHPDAEMTKALAAKLVPLI